MSIDPIVQSVNVAVQPDRAFALFAGDIGRWWSPIMHIAPEPFTEIVIEPRAGGRWSSATRTARNATGGMSSPGSRPASCCSVGSSTAVSASTRSW